MLCQFSKGHETIPQRRPPSSAAKAEKLATVAQTFLSAGPRDILVPRVLLNCMDWRLESRQNPQTGMSALQGSLPGRGEAARVFQRTPFSFDSGIILISTGLQPGGSKRHVGKAVSTAFFLPSSGEPDKTVETVLILPDSQHPAEAVC